MRLSRFQDQPASRMTDSRHSALRIRVPMLSNTSVKRRNAERSESNTRTSIGTRSFHMLWRTIENKADPRSPHPESQMPLCGRADSREEISAGAGVGDFG